MLRYQLCMVAPIKEAEIASAGFEGYELQVAYLKGVQAAARVAQELAESGNVEELQLRILRRLNAGNSVAGVMRDDLPPMLRINHRGAVFLSTRSSA